MNYQRSNLPTIIESVNTATDIPNRCNVFNIKDELEDTELDFKPAMHEYINIDYTSDQNTSIVKEENTIADGSNDSILCHRVKEESVEDQSRVSSPVVYTCDYCQKAYAHKQTLVRHIEGVHGKVFHRCSECKMNYKGKHYLQRHIKRVHSKAEHECEFCKKIFRTKQNYNTHIRLVRCKNSAGISERFDAQHSKAETQPEHRAQARLYKCDKCPKLYTRNNVLHRHKKRVHGTGSYECTECNLKYKCEEYFASHVHRVHNKQQYQCTICKKMYKNKQTLREHVKRYHRQSLADAHQSEGKTQQEQQETQPEQQETQPEQQETQPEQQVQSQFYRCNKCPKTYKYKRGLLQHYRRVHGTGPKVSEPRIYICDYCHKKFTIKTSIQSHITLVHASGSYKCSQCNKSFKCEQYLMSHMTNVHTVHRHSCNICGKCVKPPNLRQHMHDVHIDIKQLQCKFCGETMKSRHYLRKHLNDLHGQPSAVFRLGVYTCDYCQKTYPRKNTLVIHMENVHGNVFHRCLVCKVDLKSKSSLQRHIKMVHSLEEHACELCNKIFRTKQYYNKHMLVVHGKKTTSEHSESHQQSHQVISSNFGKDFKSLLNCQPREESGKCILPTVGDLNAVANTSTQLNNMVIVKEEPADGELELGPVVFQHMDCNYRPYKQEPRLD